MERFLLLPYSNNLKGKVLGRPKSERVKKTGGAIPLGQLGKNFQPPLRSFPVRPTPYQYVTTALLTLLWKADRVDIWRRRCCSLFVSPLMSFDSISQLLNIKVHSHCYFF